MDVLSHQPGVDSMGMTPGDAVSLTVFMMVPLILLYEMSILLAKMVERRRLRAAAAMEADLAAEAM